MEGAHDLRADKRIRLRTALKKRAVVLRDGGVGDGYDSVAEDEDVDEQDQDVGDDVAELLDVGLSLREASHGVGDMESVCHSEEAEPPERVRFHVAEKAGDKA